MGGGDGAVECVLGAYLIRQTKSNRTQRPEGQSVG